MNNVFDFRRFGRYLAWDLRQAWSNCGISALVLGLMPVIYFLFSLIFTYIFGLPSGANSASSHFVMLWIVWVIFMMMVPAKAYGKLTDKGYGSTWLLIPASTLEKFISMLILLWLVIPVAIAALYLASDWVLSLIFPALYGDSLFGADSVFHLLDEADVPININYVAIFAMGSLSGVLLFTLGAIIFKKAKVGKTILASMALSTVISSLFFIIFGHNMPQIMINSAEDVADISILADGLNSVASISTSLWILLLGTGIFFRLKKMTL